MVKLGFKTQQSGPEAPASFNVSVKDPPIVRASSFISTLNSTEVQGRTPDWNRDSQGILRRAGEPAAAAAGSLGKRKDGGQPRLLSTDPALLPGARARLLLPLSPASHNC